MAKTSDLKKLHIQKNLCPKKFEAPSCKLEFARFSVQLEINDGAECDNVQNDLDECHQDKYCLDKCPKHLVASHFCELRLHSKFTQQICELRLHSKFQLPRLCRSGISMLELSARLNEICLCLPKRPFSQNIQGQSLKTCGLFFWILAIQHI